MYDYQEHDKVDYQGKLCDLVWFNPCEREWMLHDMVDRHRFYFASSNEFILVFPCDAMNAPESEADDGR